jgi:hypothetical protein
MVADSKLSDSRIEKQGDMCRPAFIIGEILLFETESNFS